jgi:hypothetical protein
MGPEKRLAFTDDELASLGAALRVPVDLLLKALCAQLCAHSSRYKTKALIYIWYWRRERDSNPRYGCPHNGFRDRPIQPLWHPSAGTSGRKGSAYLYMRGSAGKAAGAGTAPGALAPVCAQEFRAADRRGRRLAPGTPQPPVGPSAGAYRRIRRAGSRACASYRPPSHRGRLRHAERGRSC